MEFAQGRVQTTQLPKTDYLLKDQRRASESSAGSAFTTSQASDLIKKFNEENRGNNHRFISTCGRYIYNLAIIDYLQGYDLEKWGEHNIKVWIYMRDGTKISATHPNPYAKRFLRFMRDFVIINQKSKQARSTSFKDSFVYNS